MRFIEFFVFTLYANLFNPYNNPKRQVHDRDTNLSEHLGKEPKLAFRRRCYIDVDNAGAKETKFQAVALHKHSQKQRE